MEEPTTLLKQLRERLNRSEAVTAGLRERVAELEALAGRGLQPEQREAAEDRVARTLELARAAEKLEVTLQDLARRVDVLELTSGPQEG